MHANTTFPWPCSTTTSCDLVTAIETSQKSLPVDNFCRLIMSSISHTSRPKGKRCKCTLKCIWSFPSGFSQINSDGRNQHHVLLCGRGLRALFYSHGSLAMKCAPRAGCRLEGFGVAISLLFAIFVLALANSRRSVWGLSGSKRIPWEKWECWLSTE